MNKTTKRAKFCRYIPDFAGSPAWMTVHEAEALLKEDIAYLDRLIELSVHPLDKAFWKARNPRIEYVTI